MNPFFSKFRHPGCEDFWTYRCGDAIRRSGGDVEEEHQEDVWQEGQPFAILIFSGCSPWHLLRVAVVL